MSRALLCLLTVGLSAGSLAALSFDPQAAGGQPPSSAPRAGQVPRRDGGPRTTGTSRIRGRVIAADTGGPLRRAQVRATSIDTRESRLTSTDADGRYEFKDLPQGRYRIDVTKGGFVSLAYGQLRAFEAGKPLEIADAQVADRINFALPRGAVMTGRIVDEFGEPVTDARVMAMRYQYVQGRRQLNASGRQGTTNDIGEYRIFGLAPGQYVLSATMPTASAMTMTDAPTDDRLGYAPTYYPGTPDASQAQRVTIGVGQALSELNMPLVPVRTARVNGTAFDSQGRPLSGAMLLALQRSGATMLSTSGTQVRPDGSFTVASLAPGDYELQVLNYGSIGDRSEMATGHVSVAGEDVNGVELVGLKATSGVGRVIMDPGPSRFPAAANLHVFATPARPEDDSPAAISAGGEVRDDYTFEVKARPGRVLLRADTPPGWTLKAVRHHGEDVTDAGIEFRRNEAADGIELELTNKTTEVSGIVTRGVEPIKDYTVVVFSTARERWGYMSRFFQTGRPDQDGRYTVKGLPPGQYYAVALDYVDPGEAADPELLDRIKEQATTFDLAEGQTKPLDLRIR